MIEKYPEPSQIRSLDDVINQLLHHQETHTLWIEYLREHNDEEVQHVGNIEFHEYVEGRYTQMIEILHAIQTK